MATQSRVDKEEYQTIRRRHRKLSLLHTLLVLGLTVANLKYRVEATSHAEEQKIESDVVVVDNTERTIEPTRINPQPQGMPSSNSRSTANNQKLQNEEENNDDVIVVIAVDGTLAGISKKDGKVLWKNSRIPTDDDEEQDHNMKPMHMQSEKESTNIAEPLLRPLVSTTTTTKSASSNDFRYAAVPSVDSNVFMTSCGETVTNSVKDLVSRSPFVDDKGRFYVGSRLATAAAVDRDTGEILKVISSPENNSQEESHSLFEGRKPVWIGRVDYSVTVQDARTGMTDVQFSVSEVIGVDDMQGALGTDAWKPLKNFQKTMEDLIPDDGPERMNPFRKLLVPENPITIASATMPPRGSSHLVATPGGNVAFRNPKTRTLEWVASDTFDSPVAFAIEASSGVPFDVNFIQDVPVPGSSLDYLSKEMERQLEILDDSDVEASDTIVGAMPSGQLYALPLGRRITPAPTPAMQHHTIASTSAATIPKYLSSVPQIIGRPSLHIDGGYQKNPSSTRKYCSPSAPNFPKCLLGPNRKDVGVNYQETALLSEDISGHNDGDTLEDGGASSEVSSLAISTAHIPEEGGFYHPEFGYISPQAFHQFQQRRSKHHKLFRILGSWLPPTIALIFVLSFELGRRKRLRDNQDVTRNTDNLIEGTGEVVWSDNKPTQTSQQCVIQVSDGILGYGGQGTVVYKGMLEGRDVAVKRMLKAYHASADREISLLIESDGHPNVVRYFLKEIRGDFVYLALELCDLSLHDLIGMLRQQQEQANENADTSDENEYSICSSTRYILQQIASGVQHLHSLRIVHRDLKPANILLATSKKNKKLINESDTAFQKFQKGLYVAKISDMGLGKQLVGQSSLGVSMIGESSLRGSKGGTSSVGVGPGSVGWQAPEVMALRWASDSSARSESSNGGPPAAVSESSPIELAPNNRTSRSVDIFSLGCIFYSTLVPGYHPFGEWWERESNIMHNRPTLDALKKLSPDAYDLVSSMLSVNPKFRPTAKQICDHPFFWNSQKKLTFLCDFSDRLETDAVSQTSFQIINVLAIERGAVEVVGTSWVSCLDDALMNNVRQFRSYDPSSTRDLLRLIRNKHHHFDELPDDFRVAKMPNQDEMLKYFEARFPGLLMHCFNCCREILNEEGPLAIKYNIAPSPRAETKQSISSDPHSVIVETQDENQPGTLMGDDEPPIVKVEDEPGPATTGNETQIQSEPTRQDEIVLPRLKDEAETIGKRTTEQIGGTVSISDTDDIIVWEGSAAAKTFNCRGWSRSEDEWCSNIDPLFRKRDPNLKRSIDDPKFRTRLCNHWDTSLGTTCPMRKKNKCVFAHGPAELRVKEGKRNRWGKLLDKNGNNSNLWHSGGEDTFGAAKSIETVRKVEGKWKTGKKGNPRGKKPPSKPRKKD